MGLVQITIHRNCGVRPLKDERRGDCCGIKLETITDGYYCDRCNLFFHKRCSTPMITSHPSHKCDYNLKLWKHSRQSRCFVCKESVVNGSEVYECRYHEDFALHVDCANYQPPEFIEFTPDHEHELKLEKVERFFTCAACRKSGNGYSYQCHECSLTFHVSCEKYAAEIYHSSHHVHHLKLHNGEIPAYTDGKCRLCGMIPFDEAFYHCSLCNFTLDLRCVFNPPPTYHHDLNIHDHQLTLMPKSISFTCTICGLPGDRSPYVCLQCDFMSHNNCSGFPWVININRHDHRVSRTSLLGVVNSVCGVCQKKMDWSCGGYSCKRCPRFVFHTKCATRDDVWDGLEMKDEPDEDEDLESFKVIDENTIRHSQHKHNLKFNRSGILIEEGSCKACAYPIYRDFFYNCMSCKFMLHEGCANLPKRKRHMVHNKPYILNRHDRGASKCKACGECYNGFRYGSTREGLDMRCASVSEPFVHKSHPHPLFCTSPYGVCSVCNKQAKYVLRCVEDHCEYIMDFKCALLPYEVKHRVDDHFLSLSYGEENAVGKYWCDICESETDSKTWFYTCKDCGVTLHTDCVLGDSRGLVVGSKVTVPFYLPPFQDFEVSNNNSMSRPKCSECKSRCIFPVFFKKKEKRGNNYYCSVECSELLTNLYYLPSDNDLSD